MRRLIDDGSPFSAQAAYSRAVVDGDWCFVSGCTGADAEGCFPEDVGGQVANTLAKIDRVLAEAGFALHDVVRARYYLTDARDWEVLAAATRAAFAEARPAATCLIVGLIDPRMKVEIEVTALRQPRG